MTCLIIGVAAWVSCGVLSAGLIYASFQRSLPTLADEFRRSDVCLALFLSILGPVTLIGVAANGNYKHGWLFPGSKP